MVTLNDNGFAPRRFITQVVNLLRSHLDAIDIEQPEPEVLRYLKVIIDTSSSLATFARPLGVQAYNEAAELKLRAERKAGQWLNLHLDE
jgi:hypothetical protein